MVLEEFIQVYPLWSIVGFSFVVTLFITIVTFFVTDRDLMRNIRARQKKIREEMKLGIPCIQDKDLSDVDFQKSEEVKLRPDSTQGMAQNKSDVGKRVKPTKCKSCRFYKSCEGIYSLYLDIYGDGDVGSDYLDVIYKDGYEELTIDAIFKYIYTHSICDEMYLFKINNSSRIYSLIQSVSKEYGYKKKIINEYKSPYIKLPISWEDYMKNCSSSMRYKIRKERRNLEKYKTVFYRKTISKAELLEDYMELTKLHQKRWANRGLRGVFSNKKFLDFHRKIMSSMLDNKHLELWFLSINNRYNLKFFYYYFKKKRGGNYFCT